MTAKTTIDRALPVITKPKDTDVEKVQCTQSMVAAMEACAGWAAAGDVQTAVKVWTASADAIDANATTIAGLRDQLRTAEGKQLTLRRGWQAATLQVLSTVNVFCNGSADALKAFGFGVREHGAIGARAAVEGLTVATGAQVGQVVGEWPRGTGTLGFAVQWATDPASATTYSAITPCTKTRHTVSGSPSGTVVYLRVAEIDPTTPTGIGPWGAWAAGTAR